MLLAVGSTRGPKVDAVRNALIALAEVSAPLSQAEVAPRDVGDVAPVMPVTLGALLEGSRLRAERALELLAGEGKRADLGVGLEGGLEVREGGGGRVGFLMAWAYVTDGRRGSHGCGGGVELPARWLGEVLDRGRELGPAVDGFAGEADVRSRQGAWGVLTLGVMDRTRSFEVAVLNALAPFYNAGSYR